MTRSDREAADDISNDERFAVLQAPRRRAAIRHLSEDPDRVVDVDSLARTVCEREATDTDPGRVAADLRHAHLPRMRDAGLVAFDPREGTIRYHGDETVERFLDALDRFRAEGR